MSAPDPLLLATAIDWLAEGRGVALATVIQTWGSAPQPVGSQLLIDAAGNFLGSVSGGCVEAEVIAHAADVIASNRPTKLEFGVADNTAWKVGLACGGAIRVFVEPLKAAAPGAPDGELHRLLSDVEARRSVALVTDLSTGAWRLAHSAGDLGEDLAPALAEAFRSGKSMPVAS
jgi:xanthine dehydrogenase accessory factor